MCDYHQNHNPERWLKAAKQFRSFWLIIIIRLDFSLRFVSDSPQSNNNQPANETNLSAVSVSFWTPPFDPLFRFSSIRIPDQCVFVRKTSLIPRKTFIVHE